MPELLVSGAIQGRLDEALEEGVRSKAIQVRSMSKALSRVRLVRRASAVAHHDRPRALLQVVRLVNQQDQIDAKCSSIAKTERTVGKVVRYC